jgi:hypothetical protein
MPARKIIQWDNCAIKLWIIDLGLQYLEEKQDFRGIATLVPFLEIALIS